MTRNAEAVFEEAIDREDTVAIMTEDFSIIDAIIEANDKESIFDN